MAICKSCQPKFKEINGSVISTTNFVKHLKKCHQNTYTDYLNYKNKKKTANSEQKSKKVKASPPKQ